jgi:hypothetical protein
VLKKGSNLTPSTLKLNLFDQTPLDIVLGVQHMVSPQDPLF